jgi:hypothetical protein
MHRESVFRKIKNFVSCRLNACFINKHFKIIFSQLRVFHSNWLEVISKFQIRFKGKASRALEAERTRKYVSISMGGTTQPLDLRWGFEITSIQIEPMSEK